MFCDIPNDSKHQLIPSSLELKLEHLSLF